MLKKKELIALEEILKQILGKLTALETNVNDIKAELNGVRTELKDVKADLIDVKNDLKDVKADLNDVKSRQDHHSEMFSALITAQETQKAQIDQLLIDLAYTNKTIEQMADDVNFLVRTALSC